MTRPKPSAAQHYRAALRANIDRHNWVNITHGLLLILTGAVAIIYPLIWSSTVSLFLGCALILLALLQFISLIVMKQLPYFSIQLVSTVVSIIVGVMLIRPGQPDLLIVRNLVLVFLVVDNSSRLIFALAVRPYPGWWIMMSSSVVGLALAGLLGADILSVSLASIALIGGANFIAAGLGISLFSWRINLARR